MRGPAAILLAIALVACGGGGDGGEVTQPKPVPDPVDTPAGCEAAVRMPVEGANHIPPNQTPSYKTNPPASGPHYSSPVGPVAPGVYTESPVDGGLVHNLEHGHVIIWHTADVAKPLITSLANVVTKDPRYRLLVPRPGMPYKVAFTAWGVIQGCNAPTADVAKAAERFAVRFQQKAPEDFPGRPLV